MIEATWMLGRELDASLKTSGCTQRLRSQPVDRKVVWGESSHALSLHHHGHKKWLASRSQYRACPLAWEKFHAAWTETKPRWKKSLLCEDTTGRGGCLWTLFILFWITWSLGVLSNLIKTGFYYRGKEFYFNGSLQAKELAGPPQCSWTVSPISLHWQEAAMLAQAQVHVFMFYTNCLHCGVAFTL